MKTVQIIPESSKRFVRSYTFKTSPGGRKDDDENDGFLDGDGFDIVLEKVLKGMSFVIFAGCLPWFYMSPSVLPAS